MSACLMIDGYKLGHKEQYPTGTNFVFSNFTPRKSRRGQEKIVFFGLQYFIKSMIFDHWGSSFFNIPFESVESNYKSTIAAYLGVDSVDTLHLKKLHELGYLPLKIWALPEGSKVNVGVPCLVIYNTHPDFYWLPNYLETILNCSIWGMCTSATTAYEYRKVLDYYAEKTSDNPEFVDFQGHDFSFRGMFGLEAATISGAAHLLSFSGTDTIPAKLFIQAFYNEMDVSAYSVNATEHSVMSAGGKENEEATIKRLIAEVYPSGVVSIVSDTWDFWNTISNTANNLKEIIMNRDGKVVFRPDSGDPADIICGTLDVSSYRKFNGTEEMLCWADGHLSERAFEDCEGSYNCGEKEYSQIVIVNGELLLVTYEFEYGRHDKQYYFVDGYKHKSTEKITSNPTPTEKGAIEVLWDIFGGTINSKGYKQLDPHVGLIYGDSITIERAKEICRRLEVKGFASTNIVFGIGSYTYQYVTRDTDGYAMKATYCEIDGVGRDIFKDPITDDGTKKSAKGILIVNKVGNDFVLSQQGKLSDLENSAMKLVYDDGNSSEDNFNSIKRRLLKGY